MTRYDDTKKLLKQRDKMLRDAYHGRNGLSMTDEQRRDYEAIQQRARYARRIARRAALGQVNA